MVRSLEEIQADKKRLVESGISVKLSKPVNSAILKASLDKSKSVKSAKDFSENIPEGATLRNCPLCQSNKRTFISCLDLF